jgi:hypothetical protein
MAINLSRNTRLWVSTVKTGHDNTNTFEIPVQDGYSLSQGVSTSDVSVEEAGPTPARGSRRFNESQEPVDWSFTTYMNPYFSTNTYLVDMIMWQALANAKNAVTDFSAGAGTVTGTPSAFNIDFTNNSAHELVKLYLYFKIDSQSYIVSDAQVGQAEVSVDISDIGMTAWSGQGLDYSPIPNPTFMDTDGSNGLAYVNDLGTIDKYVKIGAGKEYLINKLTIMELNSDASGSGDATLNNYAIPITGASVSINNNITYLTPSTLSEVDSPIGSFTGSFDVSGSVEAYLKDNPGSTGAIGSGNEYGSAELLQHMLSGVSTSVTNAANLVLYIGGKGASTQQAIITIPYAQLSVPEVSVDDVVSTSFEFKGIPQDANMLSGDEITIDFKHSSSV